MNILGSLGSINVISLLVLVGMFIFLLYELYLYQKERKRKKIVSVPSFNPQVKVTPIQPVPPVQPMPAPVQHTMPPKTKPRKKISKKAAGAVVASVLMTGIIGLISFRLSQTSPQSTVSPARPRAAALPTLIPSPLISQAPTQAPDENVSPTTKPPLLLARSLTTSPTRPPQITVTPEVPTPTPAKLALAIEVTPTQKPTPTAPVSTNAPISNEPTTIAKLPESGTSQYTFIFAGIAFFIIVVSFLY